MRTLILIAVSLFFTHPFAFADPGNAESLPSPGNENDYQTRTYDVSSLFRPVTDIRNIYQNEMFPLMIESDVNFFETTKENLDAGSIADMICQFLGDECFEHNGINVESRGTLLVVEGPSEFQDLVCSILGFLDRRLNRTVSLKLELFSISSHTMGKMEDISSIESLKDDANPLYVRDIEMKLGDFRTVEEGLVTTILYDYEPEIAQNSIVCEPLSKEIDLGFRMVLRPLIAADGTSLNVGIYGSFSTMDQPLGQRDVKFEGRVSTQKEVNFVRLGSMIDDPKISFASLGTTFLVKPDHPVLAGIAFEHNAGLGNLFIRISGTVESVPHQLDLLNGRLVECYDLGNLAARSFRPCYTIGSEGLETCWSWERYRLYNDLSELRNNYAYMSLNVQPLNVGSDHPGYFLFEIESPTGGDGFCQSMWGNPSIEEDREPQWCVAGTQFFLSLKSSEKETERALKRSSDNRDVEPLPIDVYFVESSGPPVETRPQVLLKNGELGGFFFLKIPSGSQHLGVAGLEGIEITGYDVDVATGAAIPNMNVGTYFDGALIHVKHDPPSGFHNDMGSIEARICLSRLSEYCSTQDLGGHDDILGIIDQHRFDRGCMTQEFPTDGEFHILGTLSRQKDGQPKTLYVLGRAGRK